MRTKIAKVALAGAADTGGGIGAWMNPEPGPIIISRLEADITTPATSACTMDAGTTAVGATTSSDNLIDGLDVNAAAGIFDNNNDKGTNGKTRLKLAAGGFVTFSRASGASAGLLGNGYIYYHTL